MQPTLLMFVNSENFFFSLRDHNEDGSVKQQEQPEGFTSALFPIPYSVTPRPGLELGLCVTFNDFRTLNKDLKEIENPQLEYNPNLWARLLVLLGNNHCATLRFIIANCEVDNEKAALTEWQQNGDKIPEMMREARFLLQRDLGCRIHGIKSCINPYCFLSPCGNAGCKPGGKSSYCKTCAKFFEREYGFPLGTLSKGGK